MLREEAAVIIKRVGIFGVLVPFFLAYKPSRRPHAIGASPDVAPVASFGCDE